MAFMHRSTRVRRGPRAEMPCFPSASDTTILYPVGTATMDTLNKLEFLKRKTHPETSLPYTKWPYKATLRVDQLSNVNPTTEPRVEIVSDGCRLSVLARSLDHVGYCVIRWCYKHRYCHQAWTQ